MYQFFSSMGVILWHSSHFTALKITPLHPTRSCSRRSTSTGLPPWILITISPYWIVSRACATRRSVSCLDNSTAFAILTSLSTRPHSPRPADCPSQRAPRRNESRGVEQKRKGVTDKPRQALVLGLPAHYPTSPAAEISTFVASTLRRSSASRLNLFSTRSNWCKNNDELAYGDRSSTAAIWCHNGDLKNSRAC